MQKRKLLLSLVALCSIVGMGITSCNNEPVQGPQGEQGPVGPQGPAGENGENGEDGSLILHGEGKPADTLGKDTDVYIDSKTGDLYQKENGSWTLVMNIKGEDGQDGEDGSNGSNGSDGQDGQTAWSNTILPVEGGYITSNVGSAIAGEEVTFTFVPTEDSTSKDVSFVWDIKNNGNVVYSSAGLETTAIKMMEGGFVVSGKVATSVTPTTSDGSLKVEVPTETTKGETVVVNVSEDLTASKIEISGNTNNNPVVIDGTKKDGSKATLSLSSNSSFANLSDLTFNNLVIDSKVTDETTDSLISVNSANGSLTLNNVDFKIPTTEKDKGVTGSLVKAEVASISMSGVNADFATQNNSVSLLGSQSTSVSSLDLNNLNVEGVKGTAIHIQKIANNANFDITDSTFDCESNFLTLADYDTTTNSNNKSVSINLENLNINDNGKNPIIMFNLWQHEDLNTYSSQDSASYFDVNVNNLTHNGVKLTKDNLKTEYQYNNVETENTVSTLAEGDSGETTSKPGRVTTTIKGGLLAVFDACWGDGSYDKLELLAKDEKYPKEVSVDGVEIEAKASNFVKVTNAEGDVKTAQNVFINGQLYSEVTYSDNNGDKIVLKGTPIDGIKFASGDGTVNSPLEISSEEEFNLIDNLYEILSKDTANLYYELTKDIEFTSTANLISNFAGNFNGNDHKITLKDDVMINTYASIFGYFYGDKKSTISHLEFGVRKNQPILLYSDSMWDENRYVKDVEISYITVNSLDGQPVEMNLNNFGFITANPVGYFLNQPTWTERCNYSFDNITINASIQNLGTCASPLIGSGIIGDDYDKLSFTNITVNGDTRSSGTSAGLLWGNAAYTSSSTTDKIRPGQLTVENVKLNGKIVALRGNENYVCATPGDINYLSSEQIDKIGGKYSFENVLSGKTIAIKYDTQNNVFVYDSSDIDLEEGLSVTPYLNVGRIDWGSNFSNGMKSFLPFKSVGDFESNKNYISFKNNKIIAADTNTILKKGLDFKEEELPKEFNLHFGAHDAALVLKNNTLYLIFALNEDNPSLSTTKVDSEATFGWFCFDSNGTLVGAL